MDKLKEWFNDFCQQLCIRQAVDGYTDAPLIVQYVGH